MPTSTLGNTYSTPCSAIRSNSDETTASRTVAGIESSSARNRSIPSSQNNAGKSFVVMKPCGNDCSICASRPKKCSNVVLSSCIQYGNRTTRNPETTTQDVQ